MMVERELPPRPLKIVYHRTKDIIKIIRPEKCNLVITMNITPSVLRAICEPDCEVYFVSSSTNPNNLGYKSFPTTGSHYKLYRTPTRVIFSTANASLSSFNELSFIFPRSSDLDEFINRLKSDLVRQKEFLRAFH